MIYVIYVPKTDRLKAKAGPLFHRRFDQTQQTDALNKQHNITGLDSVSTAQVGREDKRRKKLLAYKDIMVQQGRRGNERSGAK